MFWQCAINLLERMERNQPLRISGSPMFIYGGKDLTPSEIKMLLEEGRFFMACTLMKEEKYEKAIEAFQDLKLPYASFYEGLVCAHSFFNLFWVLELVSSEEEKD